MQEPTNTQIIAFKGINSDVKVDRLEQGQIPYALNANISSFDGNGFAYQNDQGNIFCTNIPEGFDVIGKHEIPEKDITVLWMVSNIVSQIGILHNSTCRLVATATSDCFNFSRSNPILKAVHRKTECSTEVYWVDGLNKPSFINIDEIPYQTIIDSDNPCDSVTTTAIDCNKTKLQPDFSIPEVDLISVRDDGELTAGSYQFAVSYANSIGERLTSVYSVTNPIPVYDPNIVSEDFDYTVSKSLEVQITNLDITSSYKYFNLYVIKTVNAIVSVYLINTFEITGNNRTVLYSGNNKSEIQGDILDIITQYPVYESASDITNAQDILILGGITEKKRVSYQKIANQIEVKWASIEKTLGDYADPLIVNKYKGYLRNEVYAFEFVPLLKDGVQRDGFHIPGRAATDKDTVFYRDTSTPTWKVLNTASVDDSPAVPEAFATGTMGYYESTELYPCDGMYGELANTPIRHHKMPDNGTSPFVDSSTDSETMYLLGILVDPDQIQLLINASDLSDEEKNSIVGFKIVRADRNGNKSIIAKGIVNHVLKYKDDSNTEFYAPNYLYDDIENPDPFFKTAKVEESLTRFTFHSPNTSFAQPSLGSKIEFEGSLHGTAQMHFKEVANHAKYNLPTGLVFVDAEKINIAYQLNSVGKYTGFTSFQPEPQERILELKKYLRPGNVGGDDLTINNDQRESSVYFKIDSPLTGNIAYSDNTKVLPSCTDKDATWERGLDSFYTSLKNTILNQYGPLYSYTTVDTGYEFIFGIDDKLTKRFVFGGDTFINRFAYKSKIPVFVDNMIGKPDNSDTIYSKKGNLGVPMYYIDAIGIDSSKDWSYYKANLYCPENPLLGKAGRIFLFIYGIPYFPVESDVNVDMRQAINDKEGDFYPHVTDAIPDKWLTEEVCSIQQDNTYNYNKTYSKQNKETFVSHIPSGYTFDECNYILPFRAVFSEPQQNVSNPLERNNWRIFKPASFFDFPQNYGKLVSLDGIENKQVYARFENKTLLYNALLTAPTNAQAVYLGQSLFSNDAPPLDFADTDMGYAGTQHKFFLKTEYGHVSTDAKRGGILLYQGQQVKDLGKQGIYKFLKKYLKFFILDTLPDFDIDNNFAGIGITGTYDSLYNRLIITKTDYQILKPVITSDHRFYDGSKEVFLDDATYFRNMSFTLSYSFDLNGWVSYHSFLPLYYIGGNKEFKTGIKGSLWTHNVSNTLFNNYYSVNSPYIIDFPVAYKYNDEILQSLKDYSKVDKFIDEDNDYIQEDKGYYNKLILFNDQQTSGILNLYPKPLRNMATLRQYPVYNKDSKDIIFTKTDNVYKVNTFWSITKDAKKALWLPSTISLSEPKVLNQDNCSYNKRSHNKAPFRAKDLTARYILDNRNDIRITHNFIIEESQESII